MSKTFWGKVVHNKKNGQVNVSLPKKKIPISCDELVNVKRIKFMVEDWE